MNGYFRGVLKQISKAIVFMAPIFGPLAALGSELFTANHYYTPMRGGTVVEWDSDLKQVGSFTIPNVNGYAGCVFDDSGHLVLIAQRAESFDLQVLKVDAKGTVISKYSAGANSLLMGSYIDYDPVRKIYAFANDHAVTYLDSSLKLLGNAQQVFSRASGVAFGAGGTLYATDQFNSGINEFDLSFKKITTIPFPSWCATAIDTNPDGSLMVCDFANGSLSHVDPVTGSSTTVLKKLGYGAISDVEVLPDGRFVTITYGGPLMLYSANGQFLGESIGTTSGDSVAYYHVNVVPSPTAAGGGVILALVAAFRMKKRG